MRESERLTFDTSLPTLVAVVRERLGMGALEDGVVVRDGTGKLAFVAATPCPSEEERKLIADELIEKLGVYAREDRVIAFADDAGAQRLLADPLRLPIRLNETSFGWLVDRRIVGSAWLENPRGSVAIPPRVVFASIKGGVGRSTALAISAADLARRNQNVLVVDLDLEAPGLGDLLLTEDRKPDFGTIDYLVEDGLGGVSESELDSFVGVSSLTKTGGGRVDVVPAFGRLSVAHPENVLPKLGRALTEDVDPQGGSISVATQISRMIDLLTRRNAYDVVLIDSRAGLAEITAPAILSLGATVLLFGTSQKQTIEGYRALFSTLRLLAQRDLARGSPASWRLMLKAVYAKGSLDPKVSSKYRDDLFELFAEYIYDVDTGDEQNGQEVTFDIDDPGAPHWPLIIPFNPIFADFDSVRDANHLTEAFYEQTFRQFMNGLDELIEEGREKDPKSGKSE